MTSYSIYKITNNNFKNYENKDLFETKFYLNKKSEYSLEEIDKQFILYEIKIKKTINDSISVEIDGKMTKFSYYTKIFRLDLIAFEDYLFAKGSYESRELFDKYLKEIKIIPATKCEINLKKILETRSSFKSISIKDYSARINKLKATGELVQTDDDIQDFLEKSSLITAITISYPCGKDIINIHIKDDCSIRLNNCDAIATIEEEANYIYSIIKELMNA